MRKSTGRELAKASVIFLIISVLLNVLFYLLICIKLNAKHKYINAIKIMMLMLLAFIAQYTFVTVYYLWYLIGVPPPWVTIGVTVLTNLGGVFHFLTFTFVKRRYQKVQEPRMTMVTRTTCVTAC